MGRLRKALEQQAGALGQPRQLYTPRVGQPVHITHQAQYLAKARRATTRLPAPRWACAARGWRLTNPSFCASACASTWESMLCEASPVGSRSARRGRAGRPGLQFCRRCAPDLAHVHRYGKTLTLDAQVVGRLADRAAGAGAAVAGLLVRQAGGPDLLLAPDDLPAFTRLQPGRVLQRQALALRQPFAQARASLSVAPRPRPAVSSCTRRRA